MCEIAQKEREDRDTIRRNSLRSQDALVETVEIDAGTDQGQLIAIVAHELRYPLVPIRNAAALLQREVVDAATIRRSADIIERQVNGMNRLIGDLVDVSRMQRGTMEIRPALAPMSVLLECVMESAQPLANERRLTLTSDFDDEPLWLNMDLLRLSQALLNIVANATRYSEGKGNVHVRAFRDGMHAVVIVSDEGIGIAQSDLESIFGMFVKSAQGMRVEPGLGIGLYLARHFIEAHGGTVTAASAGVGRGSEFIIRLPCETPPRQPPAEDCKESRADRIHA
jgi:signal transduction histidine kinase